MMVNTKSTPFAVGVVYTESRIVTKHVLYIYIIKVFGDAIHECITACTGKKDEYTNTVKKIKINRS